MLLPVGALRNASALVENPVPSVPLPPLINIPPAQKRGARRAWQCPWWAAVPRHGGSSYERPHSSYDQALKTEHVLGVFN